MLLALNAVEAVIALVVFGSFVIGFVIIGRYFKIWLQAYLAGVPISLLEVIGLSFRRINPKPVVTALIMTKQAGIHLSCEEVASAFLRGADVEKVAKALVYAWRNDVNDGDFTFQQLVETDLQAPPGKNAPDDGR